MLIERHGLITQPLFANSSVNRLFSRAGFNSAVHYRVGALTYITAIRAALHSVPGFFARTPTGFLACGLRRRVTAGCG
jgi:hypothetical protein